MSPTAAKIAQRPRATAMPRIKALEVRSLLSGFFPASVVFSPAGHNHSIELNTLVQDTNNDGLINRTEKAAAAGGKYEFQGIVIGPIAPFHGGISVDILNMAVVVPGRLFANFRSPRNAARSTMQLGSVGLDGLDRA